MKPRSNIRRDIPHKAVLATMLALAVCLGCAASLSGCDEPENLPVANIPTEAVQETTAEADTTAETTTEAKTEKETTKTPETEKTSDGSGDKEDKNEETKETETTTAGKETEPEVTRAPSDDHPVDNFDEVNSAEDTKPETTVGSVVLNSAGELKDGVNPLTGIYTGNDYSTKRPVAIMINNIKASMPQIGISQADILYECLVEGGTTRLMMLVMDYEGLDVVGSVRSSRDYYIDLAQNHDAIYVHAGGSNDAYDAITSRRISNLDGVNMYLPSTFYRDPERLKTMSSEHTLMTTGEGIVSGIKYKNYRTKLRSGFVSPFGFGADGGEVTLDGGGVAKHVIVPYNNSQFPQYIYNAKTGLYTRYQFNGQDHIDGATGERLTFKNVIILVCDQYLLNDEKNHIGIDTTGSGKGYYITDGKYIEIKWSKATVDSNLALATSDGSQLVINTGNTMINIVSPTVDSQLFFNYKAE